jgi:DNA replication and repair protein RecF
MRFQSLSVRNFRNYRQLEIEIPPGVVVFYGPNGQGKTNLMEAFHFLLRGESFRPVTSSSLLFHRDQQVENQAQLVARLIHQDLHSEVRMNFANGKKRVTLNGHSATSATLARQFPVVLFSPESLSAIKEGPDLRRQLLDDVVVTHSTTSIKSVRDFNHALKVRNRVLRDCKRGLVSRSQTLQLLESLDASFFPLATELTMARLKGIQSLQPDILTAAQYVLAQPTVDISVEYLISGQNVYAWSRADVLSAMHHRALELRDRELESGLSLVGPQRHDIRILFAGKDSRFFCSQGQQRALILSFKMAQILYHYRAHQVYPFLLLDDVLSELDPIRRSNLVGFLKGVPAQIFLTTTDLSFSMDFGDRRLNVFHIEDGQVSPA